MRIRLSQLRREKKAINSSNNFESLSQREFDSAIIDADYLRLNNVQLINFIGSHIFSEGLICESSQGTEKLIDQRQDEDGPSINPQSEKQLVQSVSSLPSNSIER
jgi:hypothetical protein